MNCEPMSDFGEKLRKNRCVLYFGGRRRQRVRLAWVAVFQFPGRELALEQGVGGRFQVFKSNRLQNPLKAPAAACTTGVGFGVVPIGPQPTLGPAGPGVTLAPPASAPVPAIWGSWPVHAGPSSVSRISLRCLVSRQNIQAACRSTSCSAHLAHAGAPVL